ncbi:Uncharacterised protein [Mycobacteroides abscessus subsp. abscessus]|nr:Uncharacterised protein [Mycobacteroides abscessus subsp. abscessus]
MLIDQKVTTLSDDSAVDTPESETPTEITIVSRAAEESPAASDETPPEKTPKNVALLALRAKLLRVGLAVALIGNGVLGWLAYSSHRSEQQSQTQLTVMKTAAESKDHAMQVALDYAKGAAEMDFKDMPGWTKRLTANTSPELTARLKDAAASMEQIIVPLQWVSTPTPIASVVRSEHDGVFVVNAFVSVRTKNVQAPDGIQSTATYTVTINKNSNWTITDVGGVDTALRAGS